MTPNPHTLIRTNLGDGMPELERSRKTMGQMVDYFSRHGQRLKQIKYPVQPPVLVSPDIEESIWFIGALNREQRCSFEMRDTLTACYSTLITNHDADIIQSYQGSLGSLDISFRGSPMPKMVRRPDVPNTASAMPAMIWIPGDGPGVEFAMPPMVQRPDVKPDMMPPMIWMPGDGPGVVLPMPQSPDIRDMASAMPAMVWTPGDGPGPGLPMPPMAQSPDVISTTEHNCPSCQSSYDGAITWDLERVRWYVDIEPYSLRPSKGTRLTMSIKCEMCDMVPSICEPSN